MYIYIQCVSFGMTSWVGQFLRVKAYAREWAIAHSVHDEKKSVSVILLSDRVRLTHIPEPRIIAAHWINSMVFDILMMIAVRFRCSSSAVAYILACLINVDGIVMLDFSRFDRKKKSIRFFSIRFFFSFVLSAKEY